MNCTVTSTKNFSGQSGIVSKIYPVQSAVSVRKSTPDRPFIFPILSIMNQLGGFSSFLQPKSLDLDAYVTEEALNGLFTMVAQEERRIRQDPVARSSALLEKVFGSE